MFHAQIAQRTFNTPLLVEPSKAMAFLSGLGPRVTGRQLQPTLDFATRLSTLGKNMWIRFVLVPGLTDAVDNVERIAEFVETLDCVERLEVLPFHQLGRDKWEATGEPYLLGDTPTPTPELIARVKGQFAAHGINVM